jgi:hypothetical protein
MRRDRICRLGSWFLWGSLGALVGVIVVTLALPFVATNSEDAGKVMLTVAKVGFAIVAGAFLAGIACHLSEGLVARPGDRR